MARHWVVPSSSLVASGQPLTMSTGQPLATLEKFFSTVAGLDVRGVCQTSAPRYSCYYFDLLDLSQWRKIDPALKQYGLAYRCKVSRIKDTHGRGMFGAMVNHPEGCVSAVPFECYARAGDPGPFRAFVGVGEDFAPVFVDLTQCPHILLTGSSGSGKSVALASIINSLLIRNDPDQLGAVFIDPKLVEFAPYENEPHNILGRVVNNPEDARGVLEWLLDYMERKYDQLRAEGFRSINDQPPDQQQRLAVFVDEFADLILADPSLEEVVVRLAQKGRACGVHLVLATQRPSVRVLSGLIKANLTTRLALRSASVVDSVNTLDHKGAETLGGCGDAILKLGNKTEEIRIQTPFITDDQIKTICDYWREQAAKQ